VTTKRGAGLACLALRILPGRDIARGMKRHVLSSACLFVLVACSAAAQRSSFSAPPEEPADAGVPDASAPSSSGGFTETPLVRVTVSLSGKMMAPNGSLPIGNGLVYLTQQEPAPLPDAAYCDECVTLSKGTFATTGQDGAFSITTELVAGDVWVVVQKGLFRRVTKVAIPKDGGNLDVPDTALTLPSQSNPSNGDSTPKMVILKDARDYDKIDKSLSKLGLKDVEIKTDRALLDDLTELLKYQIVFLPCDREDDPRSQTAAENIRSFVAAGGRLYVTDYSYEFVRQPFPGYITWENEAERLGSATVSKWDAEGTAQDQDLSDWLSSTGDASFKVEGNYTTVLTVNTVSGLDSKGNAKDVTPKVWVTGAKSSTFGGTTRDVPTTVSFEYQCGRVLFSSYHTEAAFGSTLHAQEKALLFVLLEVGVCVPPESGVQ
jgi:hypothetical protein